MRLRHKIRLERRGQAQDSTGQVEEAWTEIATVWSDIKPVSTREFFGASGERAEVTHKIRAWFNPDVAPRDRAVHQGRIFNITGVMNLDERDRIMDLMCKEAVN